jgi:hypothetical protein
MRRRGLIAVVALVSGAAVSVTFTDDPLTSGVSVIRAVHITELRTRVATLRARYALSVFTWTYPTLTAGSTLVHAQDILDLRTALGQVYSAAVRTAPSYTDPGLAIGTTIRKEHVAELRAAVIAIE